MATTERPILFSAEMVDAILRGRKTQTRRVVKSPPEGWNDYYCIENNIGEFMTFDDKPARISPYGKPGDRLWVRETWAILGVGFARIDDLTCSVAYRADGEMSPHVQLHHVPVSDEVWNNAVLAAARKWKPSIFMPRWASRITLEVTNVRVERLQQITDDDAIEEGVDRTNTSIPTYAIQRYRKLWDSINGKKYPWESNPFVWVVTFRRT